MNPRRFVLLIPWLILVILFSGCQLVPPQVIVVTTTPLPPSPTPSPVAASATPLPPTAAVSTSVATATLAPAPPTNTAVPTATTAAPAAVPTLTPLAPPATSLLSTLTPNPSLVVPSGPPGVYVTALTLEPPSPKRGQTVAFVATFSNTSGGPADFKWLVLIFQPEQKNSFGETAAFDIRVPAGVSTFTSADNWSVNARGGCLTLYAQPYFRTADGGREPFGDGSGKVTSVNFEMCP